MRKDRLLKLADFLKTVPRKRFMMEVFSTGDDYTKCGFAGCAMGWAAVSGKFRGLRWDRERNEITYNGTMGGFNSAAQLFDIDFCDSVELFTEESSLGPRETPAHVAKRIRKFVKATS